MTDHLQSSTPSARRRRRLRTAGVAIVLAGATLAGGTVASGEGSFTSFVRNVGTGFESRSWHDGDRSRRATTIAFTGCRATRIAPTGTTTGTTPAPTPPTATSGGGTATGGGGTLAGANATVTTTTTVTTVTTLRKVAKKTKPAKRPAAPHATVELRRSVKGWPDTNLGAKRVCAKTRSWGRVASGQYRFRITRINGRRGTDRLTAKRVRVRY
ncbi:MAG: hypothetical protein AB7G37_12575 [Solirubrobacteraceae bacterium]